MSSPLPIVLRKNEQQARQARQASTAPERCGEELLGLRAEEMLAKESEAKICRRKAKVFFRRSDHVRGAEAGKDFTRPQSTSFRFRSIFDRLYEYPPAVRSRVDALSWLYPPELPS